MFAMYDDDGLRFRSTIENFYKIPDLYPSKKIKENIDKDKKSFDEQLNKDDKKTEEARAKYKQMAHIDIMHEVFHVEQLMSKVTATIIDSCSIKECYDIMQEKKIQQIPIFKDDENRLKGIITLNDITRYIFSNLDVADVITLNPVSTISNKKVMTTDPMSDIRRISKVMTDFNINAMPIVNSDDRLVGMISRNDIIKAVANIPHLQIWT